MNQFTKWLQKRIEKTGYESLRKELLIKGVILPDGRPNLDKHHEWFEVCPVVVREDGALRKSGSYVLFLSETGERVLSSIEKRLLTKNKTNDGKN